LTFCFLWSSLYFCYPLPSQMPLLLQFLSTVLWNSSYCYFYHYNCCCYCIYCKTSLHVTSSACSTHDKIISRQKNTIWENPFIGPNFCNIRGHHTGEDLPTDSKSIESSRGIQPERKGMTYKCRIVIGTNHSTKSLTKGPIIGEMTQALYAHMNNKKRTNHKPYIIMNNQKTCIAPITSFLLSQQRKHLYLQWEYSYRVSRVI
jgi:hypothetical protein